jgi:hypothetical protein
MYTEYFKKRKEYFNIGDNIGDICTFIENLHSNLSQALEGKRGLSVHYVLAMEQFFGKSLYDIIYKDDDIDERIDPLTIKYAVYKNDYSLCEMLAERVYSRRIANACDEFDKTVFDYIVDRRTAGKPIDEVVRYLIDHGEIVFDYRTLVYNDHGKGKEIFGIIMELDDPEVFAKFAADGCIFYDWGEEPECKKLCYDALLASKNVYASIITPKERKAFDGVIAPAMDQTFEHLLYYCIKNNIASKCNEMISAYEEYVNRIINNERAKRSNNIKHYSIGASDNYRSVLQIEGDDDTTTTVCELINLDETEKIRDKDLRARLTALTPSEILKKINYKSLDELEDGDYYIDYAEGKIYYKMKNPTADISLFLEMTKRGYTCIPQCEIVGEELYMLEWQPESAARDAAKIKDDYAFIFKSLGEIHKVMLDMRTDGKVHSFNYFWVFDRQPNAQVRYPSASKPYLNLNFFYGSTLKSPTESLIDMIIYFFYDRSRVGNFLEKYDNFSYIASCVKESLKAYALPEVLRNFGDKMLNVIDEWLTKLVCDRDSDFKFRSFDELTHLRGVALLIKNEINTFTSGEGVE